MRVIIKNNAVDASLWVAGYIAYRIKRAKPSAKKPFVLGLPTGSTPLGVYKEKETDNYGKCTCPESSSDPA